MSKKPTFNSEHGNNQPGTQPAKVKNPMTLGEVKTESDAKEFARQLDANTKVNRFGLARHNDLLAISCALMSNPEVYSRLTPHALVSIAEQFLTEIESRGK